MLTDYFHVQLRQGMEVVLPLDSAVEVITLNQKEICPIPGVSPALLGVVNQRGKLLWVLQLSDFLGLAKSPKQRLQDNLILLVVTTESANSSAIGRECQLACVVSALKGIVTLNSIKIKPVSARLAPNLGSFLSGVTEIEQSVVGVLNVNTVLSGISVYTNSSVSI
ncbi:MAG: chemotaxis protein CheW [Gloeocapsa sp. UFS-A4-WI-NPMV-4B04]|jgi:twitching motility protein PilI|nr:chemotaxis protein CheW [Gloeocapsa sp. UFS-A4-WI-NPMV-4B04]